MIGEEAVARVAASLRISTNRARRLARTALPAGFVRSVSGTPEALLVEGPTDVAVFSALVDVPVLAVGGKNVLPLAVAVARAHGCEPRVVLDADAHHVRAHRGSERLLDQLAGTPVHVLPVDLETALRDWPSFLAALEHDGAGLATKDPAVYARAVAAARRDDVPAALALVSSPWPAA